MPDPQDSILRILRNRDRGLTDDSTTLNHLNDLILTGAATRLQILDEAIDPSDPSPQWEAYLSANLLDLAPPTSPPPTEADPIVRSQLPDPHPSTEPSAPFSPTEPGLHSMTPAQLIAHEQRINAETPPPPDSLSPELLSQLAELERLRTEAAVLKAQLARSQELSTLRSRESKARTLSPRCLPTVVGHQDGTEHPDELFDLSYGHNPSQLLANLAAALHITSWSSQDPFPSPIALVPVRLYPMAVADPKKPHLIDSKTSRPMTDRDGNLIHNLIVGQSQFRTSYCSLTLPILTKLPSGEIVPSSTLHPFSLQAYCSISCNPFLTPDSAHSKLLESSRNTSHALATTTSIESPLVAADGSPLSSPSDPPFRPDSPANPLTSLI